MSHVFHCPTCRQPSAFSERDLGSRIQCPRCQNWLTLPGTSEPPPAYNPPPASHFPAIDAGRGPIISRNADEHKSNLGRVIVVGMLALLMGGAAVAGWLHLQKQGRQSTPEVQKDGKKSGSDATAQATSGTPGTAPANGVRAPSERKPSAPRNDPPKRVEEPAPKPAPTFQDVWDEAVKLAEEWNDKEPAATQKAMLTLGFVEAAGAKTQMDGTQPDGLPIIYPELAKYGLFAFAERVSRQEAMKKNSDFKDVVKSLWIASVTAEQIANSASRWHIVLPANRVLVSQAIESRQKPLLTSATKLLASLPGGTEWLKGLDKK